MKSKTERRLLGQLADLKGQQQVCDALAVSKETLYRLRERGMPFLRIGRRVYYYEPEVLAWILENCRTVETLTADNGEGR